MRFQVIRPGSFNAPRPPLLSPPEASSSMAVELAQPVLATAALWFAPVMLGPPLLSSDIYSYAGEGDMITQGQDPTSQGMYKLHYGYIAHVDPTWRTRDDGNPYGPVQMGLAAGTVWA